LNPAPGVRICVRMVCWSCVDTRAQRPTRGLAQTPQSKSLRQPTGIFDANSLRWKFWLKRFRELGHHLAHAHFYPKGGL
jgi:hypothetical protein